MKNGFTLIELIFTIVILAITTMAIPRMVAQTAELNILAIQQELVENAKTAVVQVAKAPWDTAYIANEASCSAALGGDPDFCFVATKIHDVAPAAGVNVPTGSVNRQLGIVSESGNSREYATIAPTPKANFGSKKDKASAVSFGSGFFNDIDDYDVSFVQTIGPTPVAGNTEGDFILNTRLSVDVDYLVEPSIDYVNTAIINNVNFGFDATTDISANPTNIKLVQVTATDTLSTNPNRSVVLRYYAFNIGTGMIKEKDFK